MTRFVCALCQCGFYSNREKASICLGCEEGNPYGVRIYRLGERVKEKENELAELRSENDRLKQEVQLLEDARDATFRANRKVETLKDAIVFYADKGNWETVDSVYATGIAFSDCEEEFEHEDRAGVGGKRARKALEKIEEMAKT